MKLGMGVLAAGLVIGCGSNPSPTRGDGQSSVASEVQPAMLHFAADFTQSVTGTPVAGEPIGIAYDPARLSACRGEQNGKPAWSITGFWRLNGGIAQAFPVAGHSPTGAPIEPVIQTADSGHLELWFSNNNVWGCQAWDSSYGANYSFFVEAAPNAPGWMGNAASVISRWTCNGGIACDHDRKPLEQGFEFGTWARQRATVAHLYFDVWKSGVTDFDNSDLWKQLDVRMYYRFDSGGPYTFRHVDFERRVGNDARYAAPLRAIDPVPGNTIVDASKCPAVPLTVSADGMYVEVPVELYFWVNGVELRPAPGQSYNGKFADYAGLYKPCLP